MEILQAIWQDALNFFNIEELKKVLQSSDCNTFRSLQVIATILRTALPVLLLIEISRNIIYKKFRMLDYRLPFLNYIFNAVLGRLISLSIMLITIGYFQKYKLFSTSFTWYWFIYAYVVYEFANFLHHYLAHKVRILWCLHSTHHFPDTMNLAVAYHRFFLEQTYIDFIKVIICILLGVEPLMFFLIITIDGVWGLFIHIGDDFLPKGRLGIFQHLVFTPSHHRVHHAKNPLYMDTNFSVLLNIWDRLFGTYQPERDEVKVEYGITRKTTPASFIDANFGEIACLWKDAVKAPGIKNKILYIFMPPGWSHTGEHKTAGKVRGDYLAAKANENLNSAWEKTQNPFIVNKVSV
jgi:sterol desaturase/sphingolipid hydroxylase (fatty acid hydroxylase superfamily)